jgi:hypothetical protein
MVREESNCCSAESKSLRVEEIFIRTETECPAVACLVRRQIDPKSLLRCFEQFRSIVARYSQIPFKLRVMGDLSFCRNASPTAHEIDNIFEGGRFVIAVHNQSLNVGRAKRTLRDFGSLLPKMRLSGSGFEVDAS